MLENFIGKHFKGHLNLEVAEVPASRYAVLQILQSRLDPFDLLLSRCYSVAEGGERWGE